MRGGNDSCAWNWRDRGPRPLRLLRLIAAAALVATGIATHAETANDAVTCATCHRDQASMQPETQMGRAMLPPGKNPTLDSHPKLTFQSGGYAYTVETRHGQSQYSVTDGSQTVTLPILWTMGAGAQTWVLVRDGKLYESAVSYYPSVNGLDITTGHENIHPKTLDEAVGSLMGEENAKSCFTCHSTNAVVDHKLNLASLQPGLTCEHCHVGAAAHLAGISQGDLSSVPPRLGKLTSEDMSNFCGQCHRSWELVVRAHWKGEATVRFQPYRLANSKCFDGNDPRIACVACHDPHQPVVRDSAYYDKKCLACHAPQLTPTPVALTATSAHPKVCPVAKSNCQSCHMPVVPLPNGHLRFTDHQIRIVKPGEPYPN